MADKKIVITLRIPAEVNELLKDAADREHRSKVGHVQWLLEQAANDEYARQQTDIHKTGG